jgi:hypothetical protein
MLILKRYQSRLKDNDIFLIFNLYKLQFDGVLVLNTCFWRLYISLIDNKI